MQTRRKKILAAAVALSLVATSATMTNTVPACIPEDPMTGLESLVKKDKGKRKNKKGYFA